MAIFHLEGNIISRSQGRSSVAAAAYRSGSRLKDERTGLTHDFTKKEHDIQHTEILLPEGAPEWMKDRETLWNHVEKIEKRKDAQLSRDFNITLPKELSFEQNLALAKEFVQREFVDRGMIADMCLHHGHSQGEAQPHMHVMLSMREVTNKGFGKKVRDWNDKTLILHWREAWADVCNYHLARAGLDVKIDHRTLEAQGIDLEPQSKIGPKDAAAQMARFEEHQRLAKRNGKRILHNPDIAWKAITQQQSTFTQDDMARFVNRHTDSAEQFTQVYELLKNSKELVPLGTDTRGQVRLTTKTMLKLEQTLIEQAVKATKRSTHTVLHAHQKRALASRTLSDEQTQAFSHLLNSGDVASLVGYAGSGKSYLLGAANEAWVKAGYTVQGMTLSGIAAESLESGSGIQTHTIANRIINWENDRERLTKNHIVVIDEAGMVASRQMAAILQEATQVGAKVVLVGDPEQLQAIEAGAAFRAILERTGFAQLTEIRRQTQEWQKVATKQLAEQQTEAAISAYEERNHVHEFDTKQHAISAVITNWQEVRSNEPDSSQIILAYTRDDVHTLNEAARQIKRHNDELGRDTTFKTHQGNRDFAVSDRLYFLRNEKSLGVKNGTLGTLEAIHGNNLTVRLDKVGEGPPRSIQFNLSDYNNLDHGYAATVYKSQGITVDRAHVLPSKYFDSHTSYVALSRHRKSADIYWDKEQFKSFSHMSQTLARARDKDFTLDYTEQRGFRAFLNKTKIKEREFLLDAADVSINLKKTNTSTLDQLKPGFRKLLEHAAKKITTPESATNELKKGNVQVLIDQYKLMMGKRYRTDDPKIVSEYEKKLNQLAAYIHKNPHRFNKVRSIEPKLGGIIKERMAKIKAHEKDQGIER